MYTRPKKEDTNTPRKKELSISIGKKNDSFETLKTMCNDKSIELMESVELNNGEEMEVTFWTADIPELIGKSKIVKNDAGILSFTLNFSSTTL